MMLQMLSGVDGIYTVGELKEALDKVPNEALIAWPNDMGVAKDIETGKVYIDNIPTLMKMGD